MKLIETIQVKAEEITGTITGSVVGVIAHKTFSDIIITMTLAILTGFLGAMGAHFARVFIKYFKTKRLSKNTQDIE